MADESFGTSTQVAVLEEKVDSLRRRVTRLTVVVVLLLAVLIGLEGSRRACCC